jgi:hypothetical protein
MVKSGGLAILEWLVYLFKFCMHMGNVPEDWILAIVLPILKDNGDQQGCKNYIEVQVYLGRLEKCTVE